MRDASAGALRIATERRGSIAVVRVEGEIDLQTAEAFAAALRSPDDGGTDAVLLDLLGVPFMDSSGLRVLLVATHELGDRLVVVLSPGSPVRHLLELAEVGERIAVRATEAEALTSLGAEEPEHL